MKPILIALLIGWLNVGIVVLGGRLIWKELTRQPKMEKQSKGE